MKKSNIFFAIYSVVIILGISLFLIFYPKLSQKHDFVNSISLNCPREVTFELGDEIVLPDNFISVNPSDMVDELEISIYTKSSKTDPNNLKIDDKNISALSTGFYYVKFIAPGKNFDLYDTLVVHVVEKGTLNFVSTKQTIIQNNKETSLSDIYDINIDNPYTINCSQENVEIKNNKISTITPTTIHLEFIFDFEFYKYIFNSNIISANTLIPDPIDPPIITPPDEPEEPDTPDNPIIPDEPENPNEPTPPDTPDEPEDPNTPDEPTIPDEPETPNEPTPPDTPDEPEDPDTPDEPEDPNTPTEPEEPNDPIEPDPPIENDYYINIPDFDSDHITFVVTGTKTKFKLYYEVLYKDELCLYQAITYSPTINEICKITCDSPYIIFEYLEEKGTFTLTLSYGDLATKILTITFE